MEPQTVTPCVSVSTHLSKKRVEKLVEMYTHATIVAMHYCNEDELIVVIEGPDAVEVGESIEFVTMFHNRIVSAFHEGWI